MDQVAATEPGRLISLSLSLPWELLPANVRLGGDSRWLAQAAGLSLYGTGAAARFAVEATDQWRREVGRWRLLGATDAPPLAFFTLPPATEPAVPALWVPQALLRRSRETAILTWTARRDLTPTADIARAWLRDARGLLAPPHDSRAPAEIEAVTATPDVQGWRSRVSAATAAIAAGALEKVVLARRLEIRLSQPLAPAALADRLACMHPECRILSLPYGRGAVVAASPERLAEKRGRRLASHALAGTARRHGLAAEDVRAAAALLASAKERREHAIVVKTIAARMAEICDTLDQPPAPAVLPLRFVQHLWTPLTGRLQEGRGLLDAVCRLHPTPAVLGLPAPAARDWLAHAGESRDGLYSGVAGWLDLAGDGEAQVVLRSAYLEDRTALLWAGAGIMAESDADAEFAETELKLATMLEVLNAP